MSNKNQIKFKKTLKQDEEPNYSLQEETTGNIL